VRHVLVPQVRHPDLVCDAGTQAGDDGLVVGIPTGAVEEEDRHGA